jgi:hypothetical protein
MRPRVRRLAVIVGASAVLGATGCGAVDTSSQPQPASAGTQQQPAAPQSSSTPGSAA